jgi:hypothetical protein
MTIADTGSVTSVTDLTDRVRSAGALALPEMSTGGRARVQNRPGASRYQALTVNTPRALPTGSDTDLASEIVKAP